MERERVVEIADGRLRGVTTGAVRRFLGIPYAVPPVGLRRWQPPAEVQPWLSVRDATTFASDSYQQPDIQLRGSGLSEDCLYLNVWTPDNGVSEAPVMVWLHGNGYTRGSGSHKTYDGNALAARGVVVVTLNYRLGLAGFLAHPDLTRESEYGSSGNYGLLDQIAALRWVQRNIRSFGGDPTRVTVFGQSAGATCTQLLMASPLARGLFSQAILHSPGSMRPMADLPHAEQAGLRVGASINDLRQLSIAELWPMASLLVPAIRRLASPRGMGPIVDGWVVHGDDISNYREGRVMSVPLMVGVTANEGRRLTERMPMRTAEDVRTYLADSFGHVDAIPQAYMPTDDASAVQVLDKAVGDTQFNYGAWSSASEMLRAGSPVYRYIFRHPIPGCDLAPTHDDELPFVFGTLQSGNLWQGSVDPDVLSTEDHRVSDLMGSAWVSFAKTGSPSCQALPCWPRSDDGEAMIIEQRPHIEKIEISAGLGSLRRFFGHEV